MRKYGTYWIFVLITLLVMIGGCVKQENVSNKAGQADTPKTEVQERETTSAASGVGLGNLCSGEKECNAFCLNNRGRCEKYCRENKGNELCAAIFPVETLNSCSEGKEFFNTSPITVSNLVNIAPLGSLNPTSHVFPTDHIYMNVVRSNTNPNAPAQIKVFSPGDVHILQISSSEHLNANPPFTDYDLDFYPCKEIFARFGHITSLSEKILARLEVSGNNCNTYSTGGGDYRRCTKNVDIELKAGEDIGTVGGFQGAAAGLDFWLADYRTEKINYANPSRWGGHSLYIACPVDYFISDIRSNLYEQFKDFNGNPRTIEPVCGTVEQDVFGTAQGVWFVKDTKQTYPEDQHMALVHDNFNPLKEVFSIGTSVPGLSGGTYYFDPKNSGFVNRDFKDVLPSGDIYCYDSLTQRFGRQVSIRIILQLTNAATLKIEKQDSADCGNGPWAFTSEYTDFER